MAATAIRPPRPAIVGWAVVGWAAVAIVAIQAASLAVAGTGEEGVRLAVRASARTSVALFSLAFAAASLFRLWPTAFTRWLLANRRYVGVSFAVSHGFHLAGLIVLARLAPGFTPDPVTLVVGGLGYVFVAAMTATSFDRTAAWLGPRRWRLLHKTGAYYVWFVFFVSYLPVGPPRLVPSLFFAVVVAVPALRFAAWRRARRGPMATTRRAHRAPTSPVGP